MARGSQMTPIPEIPEAGVEIVEETQYEDFDDNGETHKSFDETLNHNSERPEPQDPPGASSKVGFQVTDGDPSHVQQGQHQELLGVMLTRPKSSGGNLQEQYIYPAVQGSAKSAYQARPRAQMDIESSAVLFEASAAMYFPVRGENRQLPAMSSIVMPSRQAQMAHNQATPQRLARSFLGEKRKKSDGIKTTQRGTLSDVQISRLDRPKSQDIAITTFNSPGDAQLNLGYYPEVSGEIWSAAQDNPRKRSYSEIHENVTTTVEPHTHSEHVHPEQTRPTVDAALVDSKMGKIKARKSRIAIPEDATAHKPLSLTPSDAPGSLDPGHGIEDVDSEPRVAKQHRPSHPTEEPGVDPPDDRGRRTMHGVHSPIGNLHEGFAGSPPPVMAAHREGTTHEESEIQAPLDQSQESGQQKTKSRKRQQRTRNPTVAETLQVLGIALQAEMQQNIGHNDAIRESHNADLVDMKATISRLELELESTNREKHELIVTGGKNVLKLKQYTDKVTKLQKFLNGLNNDVQRERAAAKERDEQISALKVDSCSLAEDRIREKGQLAAAIADAGKVKAKLLKELRELQKANQDLHTEKMLLFEELSGKKQELAELTNERDYLKEQAVLQKEMHEEQRRQVEHGQDLMVGKLCEMQSTLEALNGHSTTISEVAASVQELRNVNFVVPEAVENVREAVEGLEVRILSQLEDLKDKAWADQTKPAPAIPATDIQEEIREHLNELQSEIIQLQSLQKLVGVLQEERMTATERLDDQNRQIEELTERIEAMKRREQTLHEKNAQLEKQLQDQVVPETQVIDNGTEVGVYLQKQRVATKEREIALRAQVEELRSAMGSKEDERRSLARKVEAMQSEGIEKLNTMRVELAKDADRIHKDQKAEYENKLREARRKYQQAEKVVRDMQAAAPWQDKGQDGARKGQQPNGRSRITQTALEAALSALRLEHEATETSLRDEHETAMTSLRREHKAALAEHIKRTNEELKSKVRQLRKELSEVNDREREGLELRVSEAESARSTATLELEKKKQGSELLTRQLEEARSDVRDQRECCQKEGDVEMHRLSEAHKKTEEALRQRAEKAEAELRDFHNSCRANEKQPSPVTINAPTFRPSTTGKKPARVANRADTARSQTPRSNIFDDDNAKEQENRPPLGDDARPPVRRSGSIRQYLAELGAQLSDDRIRASVEGNLSKNSTDDSVLSVMADSEVEKLKPSSSSLVHYFEPKNKEPRANSSQRLTSSSSTRTHRGGDTALHKQIGPPPMYMDLQSSRSRPSFRDMPTSNIQIRDSQVVSAYTGHELSSQAGSSRLVSQELANGAGEELSSALGWGLEPTRPAHRMTTYGHHVQPHKPSSRSKSGDDIYFVENSQDAPQSKRRRSSTLPDEDSASKRSRLQVIRPQAQIKRASSQSHANPFQQHNEIHRPLSGVGQSMSSRTAPSRDATQLLTRTPTSYQAPVPLSKARSSNIGIAHSTLSTVQHTRASVKNRFKKDSELNKTFDANLRRSSRRYS